MFERSAEIDKFCCQDCFLRSAAIRAQLETEPLWIRGEGRGILSLFYTVQDVDFIGLKISM